MPRDLSGNYTLPAGNPVTSGAVIASVWANNTLSDIATQLNNVLTRDGLLGPAGPVKFANGTVGAPSVTFAGDAATGLYRPAMSELGVVTNGLRRGIFNGNGWNGDVVGDVTGNVTSTAMPVVNGFNILPRGLIMMWAGAIADIPGGWVLCNGANGTPDLRDRFIYGAGGTYGPYSTGGNKDAIVVSHSHTASSGGAGGHSHYGTTNNDGWHSHDIKGYWSGGNGTPLAGPDGNSGTWNRNGNSTEDAGTHNHYFTTSSVGDHSHSITVNATGSGAADANMPPYYTLAFIMKT